MIATLEALEPALPPVSDADAPADVESFGPSAADEAGPRLPLHELVRAEADGYRLWRTDVGDLLARTLDSLAASIRFHRVVVVPDAVAVTVGTDAWPTPEPESPWPDDFAGVCPVD